MPAIYVPDLARLRWFVDTRVVPQVERFRAMQDHRGRIAVRNRRVAASLLRQVTTCVRAVCRSTGQPELAEAFAADADRWSAGGLGNRPDYAAVCKAYSPGAHGSPTFFIAPVGDERGPSGRRAARLFPGAH